MRSFAGCIPTLALALLAATTSAAGQSTFRITELFSNQDGSIQFIRLTETAGLDDQNAFAGLAITVTQHGLTRQWSFPNDLSGTQTAYREVVVGIAPTVPAPQRGNVPAIFQYTGCCSRVVYPDYVLPQNFLPTDGGTVDFAGIDHVAYAALPTDGATALFANGTTGVATLPGNVHPTPTLITAVEYYNAAQDHYFITASSPEIQALDSGGIPGWERTGDWIPVASQAVTHLGLEYTYYGLPVCRFYIPPAQGDSHFFSASADECAAVESRFPSLVLETSSAFYVTSPDPATGQCPVMPGFIDGDIALGPVYRLWNGRADSNHRYTTHLDVRAAMIARGWIPEGYGPLGVVWCV